jgi:hypothetical protein
VWLGQVERPDAIDANGDRPMKPWPTPGELGGRLVK